jgi:hypothetical protein
MVVDIMRLERAVSGPALINDEKNLTGEQHMPSLMMKLVSSIIITGLGRHL